jgi:hypothetical protein
MSLGCELCMAVVVYLWSLFITLRSGCVVVVAGHNI